MGVSDIAGHGKHIPGPDPAARWLLVIMVPLEALPHSTASTPRERPLIIRFRTGKCSPLFSVPGGYSDNQAARQPPHPDTGSDCCSGQDHINAASPARIPPVRLALKRYPAARQASSPLGDAGYHQCPAPGQLQSKTGWRAGNAVFRGLPSCPTIPMATSSSKRGRSAPS